VQYATPFAGEATIAHLSICADRSSIAVDIALHKRPRPESEACGGPILVAISQEFCEGTCR